MIRLLRILARKPKALGCGCATVFTALLAIVIAIVVSRCASSTDETKPTIAEQASPDAAPRLLLGRGWFDKLPERRTDSIDLWVFFGGGIGVHQSGSWVRGGFDIFEFERRGATIDAKYLQDKKGFKTKFSVRACDDHAPFNLCLTIENLDGKKVELYGFAYDDEMEEAAPGSKSLLNAAKALSEGSK